jgi:hypothetical protein
LRSINGRAATLSVEMQKIEQVKHKPRRAAGVRCGLQAAEGRNAVGADAAQFAVEIGLTRVERRHGFGDRGIFVRPVEPGAGEQGDRPMVEARMQPVAVKFDFMEPLVAVGRVVGNRGELRPHPLRQWSGCLSGLRRAWHWVIGERSAQSGWDRCF